VCARFLRVSKQNIGLKIVNVHKFINSVSQEFDFMPKVVEIIYFFSSGGVSAVCLKGLKSRFYSNHVIMIA